MKAKSLITLLFVCCLAALAAAIFASSHPDGLEWVAEKIGFIGAGEGKEIISSPAPDYAVPGVKNPLLSTVLAGIGGIGITFILIYAVGRILAGAKKPLISHSRESGNPDNIL